MSSQRGSASIEVAILTPVFMLLLAGVILVGRVQVGRADVEAAAHTAARSLSLARDPQAVEPGARQVAEGSLNVGAPTCRTMGWDVNATATDVTVTVSCVIDLAPAAMLPIPGASYTVEATATEVIDQFRENADGSAT